MLHFPLPKKNKIFEKIFLKISASVKNNTIFVERRRRRRSFIGTEVTIRF
jgi:hypothetical protein